MDIEIELGFFLFVFEDIVFNDFGQYKCIIINIVGKVVISVQFKVLDEGIKGKFKVLFEVVKVLGLLVENELVGNLFEFVKKFFFFYVVEGDVVRFEVIVDGIFNLMV